MMGASRAMGRVAGVLGAGVVAFTLAACAVPTVPPEVSPARVAGLAQWQGADAKRRADAECGPRGVRPSVYDRYEAGVWVFVEGCR